MIRKALLIAIATSAPACSKDADIEYLRSLAAECGVPDLKLSVIPGVADRVKVDEPHYNGMFFVETPPEMARDATRSKRVRAALACMEPKLDGLSVAFDHPVALYVN